MDPGSLFGRGMAFPPRVDEDGRLVWSDGVDNIREAVRVILMTEPGERLMLPDFGAGLGRFLSEPNTVATRRAIGERIMRALARWEPRINVVSVVVDEDPDDPRGAVATVTWRLVATRAVERVSLNVPVGGGR
jgi:phage baseplate assembly protein W